MAKTTLVEVARASMADFNLDRTAAVIGAINACGRRVEASVVNGEIVFSANVPENSAIKRPRARRSATGAASNATPLGIAPVAMADVRAE